MKRLWIAFGGTGTLGTALSGFLGLEQLVRLGRADLDLDLAVKSAAVGKIGLDQLSVSHSITSAVRDVALSHVTQRTPRPSFGVLNLAAVTDVNMCQVSPVMGTRVNTVAAGSISAAFRGLCPVVHVSTDYVFGGSSGPHSPSSEPSPVNEYGAQKLAAERLAMRHDATVARMSFIEDDPGYDWVVSGHKCTKETATEAARRLAAFLLCCEQEGGFEPPESPVHLVGKRHTTLEKVVRKIQGSDGLGKKTALEAFDDGSLKYEYPSDVRLKGAWRVPKLPHDRPEWWPEEGS